MKQARLSRIITILFCLSISIFISGCEKKPSHVEKKQTQADKQPQTAKRTWLGPQYWANRLQDWQYNNGKIECIEPSASKPMRTVHYLPKYLTDNNGNFQLTVDTGIIPKADTVTQDGATGFLIGAGKDLDYRAASLIHHSAGTNAGIFAGVKSNGTLFFNNFSIAPTKDQAESYSGKELVSQKGSLRFIKNATLKLDAQFQNNKYTLTLTCIDNITKMPTSELILSDIAPEMLIGNVAIVSHPGSGKNSVCFWFKNWSVTGEKFAENNDRLCGPILSTQYTLDGNIMKLSAQLMPIGKGDSQNAELQIKQNEEWKTIANATIQTPAYIAVFKISPWSYTDDVKYRVLYTFEDTEYAFEGMIRKNPLEKDEIAIAAFTGNHNCARPGIDHGQYNWTDGYMWFPHSDITASIEYHNPDLLFFSGDQVYESASPTGADKRSEEKAMLDYLYKWYLWCWAYKDLCRNIPAVTIPDDHDVFQGNLWGDSGKPTKDQGDGGYVLSPAFVNLVQDTQTSHLPDPYDPTPVKQGIQVYYCELNYGGISYAIIEDRKFKSSARNLIPGSITVGETEFNKSGFDPKTDSDVPNAVMLGQRQLDFLENWSANWGETTWAKTLLSQTIFAHIQTFPKGKGSKGTKPLMSGDYPEDEIRTNTDSNGWPQTGRNKALRAIRKGFAIHIAGDTHLGNTIQYGIDEWKDAGFALCVPSVANFYPRRWYPPEAGLNQQPDTPKYTGDFIDSFGNKVTVYAVSNPEITGKNPAILHDRAPGYGIAKINKKTGHVILECWPRWAKPQSSNAKQYFGWPVEFNMSQNYARKALGYLPELEVSGIENPVVQIINESTGEIVYTKRILSLPFKPMVFEDGSYTVKVGPSTDNMKSITGVKITPISEESKITVEF